MNEQLKTAGAKELNSYLPLDMWQKEVSVNTSGGSNTTSGATTNKVGASGKVNLNDIPKGTKLESKGGKYYYKGQEVIAN